MVVLRGVGNAKSQGDDPQKGGLALAQPLLQVVIAQVKVKLIDTLCQRLPFQQGLITTAVCIGTRMGQGPPLIVNNLMEMNFHIPSRLALRGIQYMRSQSSHGHFRFIEA